MSFPHIVSSEQYRSPSSIWTGLSSQEAVEHFSKYGSYDPTPVKRGVAVVQLLPLSLNPLVKRHEVLPENRSRRRTAFLP
jgi:hypothetical protein